MNYRGELVTGQEKAREKHKPCCDDEGRREGRSTFYTTASQLDKSAVELETDLDKQLYFSSPYSSPPAAQHHNDRAEIVRLLSSPPWHSLEASRASVTSADVQMIEGEQNTSVQGSLKVSKLSTVSYIVVLLYKCDWHTLHRSLYVLYAIYT